MVKNKKSCKNCKFYDSDWYWEDDGDEYEVRWCEKDGAEIGDDTIAEDCSYYKKQKPYVYHEEYTDCDRCEYQSDCIKYGYIDCTTSEDSMSHIMCSHEHCRKKGKK